MIYRKTASDFVVHELPRFEAKGEGDYELLWVEKHGRDTAAVAADLAKVARCSRNEVGFAGRKDRIAVTRQWFSVPWARLPADVEIEDVRILDRARHDRHLRLGDLRGNRFVLRVREVPVAARAGIRARFQRACEQGFDNRFGHQRFGRDGDNAERGLGLLRGEKRVEDRRLARLLVSAFQSDLFNRVLERRKQETGAIELISGDLVRHHQSGGLRWIGEPAGEDQRRYREGVTSPTGPMFGAKMRWPRSPADRWEREVLAESGLDDHQFRGPKGLKIWGDRRALCVPMIEATMTDEGGAGIGPEKAHMFLVEFTLLPGSYASVCLEEIFGEQLQDASRSLDTEA